MSEPAPSDESLLDRILEGRAGPSEDNEAAQHLIGLIGSPRAGSAATQPAPISVEELEGAGFRTLGLLGSGAHASVFDAQDLTLGRRVALKVVHAGATDSEARRTFLREARTLARIDHPNVVRIWSAEARGDRLLLALERIEGETLRERLLRAGPWPPRAAARLALDVARGLAAVHAAGILHRDLNPGNVMLRSDGTAVLLDFSLARSDASERLQRGGTTGSPAYEAPEVLAGGVPCESSDVYALGMLLLWMVSGRTPLRGATWAELRRSAIRGTRAPMRELCPGLPRRLQAVLGAAIDVDPARRTRDARTLARQLEGFLAFRRRFSGALAGVSVLLPLGWLAHAVHERTSLQAHREAELRQEPLAREEVGRFGGVGRPPGLNELWSAGASTLPIPTGGGRTLAVPEEYPTIQAAVDACADGDVISVDRGEYLEHVLVRGRSVVLFARWGPEHTTIHPPGDGPALRIDSRSSSARVAAEVRVDVRVIGFEITGGNGPSLETQRPWGHDRYGGGLSIQGPQAHVNVERCAIWGNGGSETTFGGGLAVRDNLNGSATLDRCLVVGNAAWASGGGILVDAARLTLRQCTVVDNVSGDFDGVQGGIGLANGARVEIVDSIVWGNYGAQVGGFEGHDNGIGVSRVRSLVQGEFEPAFGAREPNERELFVDARHSDWRLRPDAAARFDGAAPGALPVWARAPEGLPEPSERESWARRLRACPKGVIGLGALGPCELPPDAVVLRVPADHPTIQAALAAAPAGSWVLVAPGIYHEALSFPARSLHLVGEHGAGATVVDATRIDLPLGGRPVLDLRGGASGPTVVAHVQGLSLRGGRGRSIEGNFGGGIAASGRVELDLRGCVVWDCGHEEHTYQGGGAWIARGARLVARDVLFVRNSSPDGSVLSVEDGNVELVNCTISGGAAAAARASVSAIRLRGSSELFVRRCILWGGLGRVLDLPPDPGGAHVVDLADSLVEGGCGDDPGVLDLDPGFVDAERDDWRVQPGGPAAERGWGLPEPRR